MTEKDKAKRVFLKLIAASGNRLEGTVRLVKAFYYAHLFHWDATGETLTDYPIIRLPNGPAVDDYDKLLLELARDGFLKIEQINIGFPNPQDVYITTAPVEVDDEADAAIKKAADFIRGKTGAQLIKLTHDNSHSWKEAKNREELDIYRDSMSKEDYEAMKARIAAARDDLIRATQP